jgi:hypothetical protein
MGWKTFWVFGAADGQILDRFLIFSLVFEKYSQIQVCLCRVSVNFNALFETFLRFVDPSELI